MEAIGTFLKTQRKKKKLSLKDVQFDTLITDTRLRRIENGTVKEPSPKVLKVLAEYYEISIVDLYIKAGYLTNNSVCREQRAFYNVDKLSDNEFQHIQQQIDYLIEHKTNKWKEVL